MSTISDLITKWSEITTQSSLPRWEEMQAFFSEAEELKITSAEIMKKKNDIISIWVPTTWSQAQKLNPTWKERSWWSKRKAGALKTFDKWWAEYPKDETAKQTKPVTLESVPIFDNIEDFTAWKNRNKQMA